MHRLGIVGCGLTGAVTAMLLKQKMPELNIVILEKARGTGGRMCTSRSSLGSSIDLGAQFITKTSNLTIVQELCYKQLLDEGILTPLQGGFEGLKVPPSTVCNYTLPHGSGSIVKSFLKQAGCEILFDHRVKELVSSNCKWKTICENGSSHEFDALVLTIPVPQVLQLEGLTPCVKSEHLVRLRDVKYCSRFAVGFFYDKDYDFFKTCTWNAKFLSDDIIRYCSLAAYRQSGNKLPAVVFHTSKEFGKQYIDEATSVTQELIMGKIKQLFPEMPMPTETKFHKWRYSQVEKPSDAMGCVVLSKDPLLICGGDGFTHSNFESCIQSAEKMVQCLM